MTKTKLFRCSHICSKKALFLVFIFNIFIIYYSYAIYIPSKCKCEKIYCHLEDNDWCLLARQVAQLEMSFDSKIAGFQSEYYDPYTIKIPQKLEEFPNSIQLIFNDYIEFHNNATSDRNKLFQKQNKFIIARTASGLANRMLLIATSFLASILTDRILLVQWENYGSFSKNIKQEYFRKLFVAPESVFSYRVTNTSALEDSRNIGNSDFLCGNLKKYKEQFLIVDGTRTDAVPMLYNNHYFKQEVRNIFGEDFWIYALNFLFEPIPSIRSEIERVKTVMNVKPKNLISIHIRHRDNSDPRLEYSWGMERDQNNNLAWKCSGLEKFKENKSISLVSYLDVNENTRWFLASDNHYTRRVAWLNYGRRVYSRSNPLGRGNDLILIQETLVDLFILSYAQQMVGTSWSTFSYVAGGLGYPKKKKMVLISHHVPEDSPFGAFDEHYWQNKARYSCGLVDASHPCSQEWFHMHKSSCMTEAIFKSEAKPGRYC